MRDWRLTENPWDTLARYNAEVARGLVHTDQWRIDMADLQRQFDEEQHARLIDEGFHLNADGTAWKLARQPSLWRRWLGGAR